MSSSPVITRSRLNAALADIDSLMPAFTDDLLDHQGIAKSTVPACRYAARHFLIWLALKRIDLEGVDTDVIHRFLQHDCNCCAAAPASVLLRPWRKRRSSPRIMRFVRFLERQGRIKTPGDLDENLGFLDEFLEGLRGDGYRTSTIRTYRNACSRLIAWLHLSRIALRNLTPDVYARYRKSRFHCSIPGVFHLEPRRSFAKGHGRRIHRFLQHLTASGRIEPMEPEQPEKALPERVERFQLWLQHHRGNCQATIDNYIRTITLLLADLGDDPQTYDAGLIRRVLFEHMEHGSRYRAKNLAGSMRMYLRFLVMEGSVTAGLVAAVPAVPQWRLGTLPRYISAEDIERAIASCGDSPVGVRDRAILLLLARLALRAGDITAMRLADIDWDRAELHVSGKGRRGTALPLPQDAGDALHAYIAAARPRTTDTHVFLLAQAPCRPLGGSTVASIVGRAMGRAGIAAPATGGARLFRHSQATNLLRSGASLDMIQALLRHVSSDTTMIYAKTDMVMLQEIAQPWVGEVGQ
ncbi:MAG: tyrosine-type recombinase/integrase [Proteobacteria bacterium]|nr:tyrosine-type recombinase/integrase [Pseudomonadota bacterium]